MLFEVSAKEEKRQFSSLILTCFFMYHFKLGNLFLIFTILINSFCVPYIGQVRQNSEKNQIRFKKIQKNCFALNLFQTGF